MKLTDTLSCKGKLHSTSCMIDSWCLTLTGNMASLAGETHTILWREAAFWEAICLNVDMEIIYKFLKNDHTSKFQFPGFQQGTSRCQILLLSWYARLQTLVNKSFQYFIWQDEQGNWIFFLMKGISHISGILIYWGIRHMVRLSLSPRCVCARATMFHPMH